MPRARLAARKRRHVARIAVTSMDELRVPKHRVPAEVLLPGGATRRIALFLAEAAPDHDGPERPLDLLNGRSEFLPAFDEETGQITFVNRAAVSAVRVASEFEPEELPTIPTEHEVELLLSDGAVLRGFVTYVRPLNQARLVDFLNEPTPFLRLHEGDSVALVNKRHVARVALFAR